MSATLNKITEVCDLDIMSAAATTWEQLICMIPAVFPTKSYIKTIHLKILGIQEKITNLTPNFYTNV